MKISISLTLVSLCLAITGCNSAPEEPPEDITEAIPVDADEADASSESAEVDVVDDDPASVGADGVMSGSASQDDRSDTMIRGSNADNGRTSPDGPNSKLQKADPVD